MLSLIVASLLSSAPPPGKPAETVKFYNTRYQFYIVEKDNTKKFKICVQYTPTGTRIRRNTCNGPTPFPITSLRPPMHPFMDFDPQLGFPTLAAQLAEEADKLLEDNELSDADRKELRALIVRSRRNVVPFNPFGF